MARPLTDDGKLMIELASRPCGTNAAEVWAYLGIDASHASMWMAKRASRGWMFSAPGRAPVQFPARPRAQYFQFRKDRDAFVLQAPPLEPACETQARTVRAAASVAMPPLQRGLAPPLALGARPLQPDVPVPMDPGYYTREWARLRKDGR